MQSLEDGTRDWKGAVIAIGERGEFMFRPAAFVFDVPGGVAWIEPAYADPAGAGSTAFHVWLGARSEWNQFTRQDDRLLQVLPYDPAEDRDLVGEALEWFAGWLKAEGRSWAQERERVRALVVEELA